MVYSNGDVKLHKVVGIGRCAGKSYNDQVSKSISSLTIPKSVKKIGDYAFYMTSNLTSVTIPDNSELEYIGRWAFSLENKTDSSTSYSKCIAPYAFYKSKITSITIPKGIEEIGLSAFQDCDSLQDITFAVNALNSENKYTSSLKTIKDYAFHDTSSIQHIYLSVDGVRVTDHYYTTFPEGLEKIGKLILGGTNGNLVGNLVFPDTISNLGAQMFNQTGSFKNELLYVGDGITTIKYTGTGDNIISFNGSNAEGTFNRVPQAYTLMLGKSVINIEENALRNYIDTREIILPDSGNTQLTIASGSVRLPGLIIIQSELDGLTNLQSILNTRRTNNDTYKTKPTYVVFTNIDSNQKNDILTSVLGLDSNNKLNGTQIYPVFSDEINLSKIQTIHQHLINQNDDNHNYTEQDINYYFQDLSMFSNANKSLLNGYVNIDDFTTSTKKGLSPQALRILL